MAKHNITVSEVVVVDGRPVVRGLVGDIAFEAEPKRWGSKMLMNVKADGLDRGVRVAIGHRAKAAIRAANLVLPEAVLVRPRKEVVVPEPAPVEEANIITQLELVLADDGFFSLTGEE
jgi:hypothetical protein